MDGATETWSAIADGLTNRFVLSMLVANDELYVGTQGGGVFRLDGDEWVATDSRIADLYITDMTVSGDTIYAVELHSDVFQSVDRGQTWEPLYVQQKAYATAR